MYKYHRDIAEAACEHMNRIACSQKWKIVNGPDVDYATVYDVLDTFKHVVELTDIFPFERWYKGMLIKIPPGGKIKRHSDNGGVDSDCKGAFTKYHIPLSTNKHCVNYSYVQPMQTINLKIGCVYEFDSWPEHESFNYGPTDRIHLVIDVYDQG